ncbi:hypothetical protein HN011_001620 [Eciton burchellii]|nr:hypothetical protein HN011_001620 [Eciton burchellii]
MAMKHIVVGGGSGFIGSRLIEVLSGNNIPHTCISRIAALGRMSWTDVERFGLPEDTSAVINLAGQNVFDMTQKWSTEFKEKIRNSRVGTTKILATAIQNTKAKVFICISGVAGYKPHALKEYTEESQSESYDFLSTLCYDWEKAGELAVDSNIRKVIIRSGAVLGKHGGMIKQIYLPFYLGLGGPMGSGKQYMPWIHIDDLVNMFLFALQVEKVYGILNGVAPQVITNNEFSHVFATALRRPAIISTPKIILDLLLNEERARMIIEGQKVIPKRVIELGFQYQYPTIKEAIQQIIK